MDGASQREEKKTKTADSGEMHIARKDNNKIKARRSSSEFID
jgi:hypothetical protein